MSSEEDTAATSTSKLAFFSQYVEHALVSPKTCQVNAKSKKQLSVFSDVENRRQGDWCGGEIVYNSMWLRQKQSKL